MRRPPLTLVAATAGISLLLGPGILQPETRLAWNISPSVPTGLYSIGSAERLRHGELVAV